MAGIGNDFIDSLLFCMNCQPLLKWFVDAEFADVYIRRQSLMRCYKQWRGEGCLRLKGWEICCKQDVNSVKIGFIINK